MAYQIITDGSCDLDPKMAKDNGLIVVPFYVSYDGEKYYKEIEEVGIRDFYQHMVDEPKVFPKTSLPSVQDYIEAFTPVLEAGKDIVCICITTKFSGSYNSASNAKSILEETYPDARIEVIDATVNTVLQGILVLEAAKMQQRGDSYEEVIAGVERIKGTGRIFFTVGSMDYLIHGGRVGKLAGIAAGTLGIKPLITLKDGEIFPGGIARGRKRSKAKIIELVLKHFEEIKESPDDYTFVVGYGYDYEEGVAFRDELLQALQSVSHVSEIDTFQIGATIGVHTGPYPLGVSLVKKA